jgi:mono/diheme cytochrome c family protein
MSGIIAVFLLLLEGSKPDKMYKGIFYTHLISVTLFLLIYLVKTVMLLANKNEGLASFTKMVKVPEMIISTLFLVTGIYMLTQIPVVNTLLIIKIVVVLASIPLAIIGFKKKNKGLAVLAFMMIVGAYGLAEMSKKKSMVVTDGKTEMAATSGHDLFMANCTSCHGEDGKLQLMGAADLSASSLDINAKMDIIKNGKGAMTPFGGELTEEQIKAVAEFTETLKK